jgi:uncharacterized protein
MPLGRGPKPMRKGAPGGFLAGAGQTAMGVVGGMLLANAVAGVLGVEAQAAEAPAEAPAEAGSDMGDAGFEDDSEW